jgi:hypothetical protein
MIPAKCRVRHDTEEGTFGDCMRAVIASVLELDADTVPHFFHDNPEPEEGQRRVREWLSERGLAQFTMHLDGSIPLEDVLEFQGAQNPGAPIILLAQSGGGTDHVVIVQDGKITHDPSWFPCGIKGPNSAGYWSFTVIVRK